MYYTKYDSKVRKEPGLNGEVLTVIPANTLIYIMEKTEKIEEIQQWKDYWYKIYYNNLSGYIYGGLMEGREINKKKIIIDKNSINSSNYKLYTVKKANFSIECPKNWEIIQEDDGSKVIFLSKKGEGTFLSLGNEKGQYGPGRGGFWGDNSLNIDSEKYILDNYNNFNTALYLTDNNITVLHRISVYINPRDESPVVSNMFYIYNPNSIYHGILFSPAGHADWNGKMNANEVFYMINSIKLK